jgi:tellurite resistance protein
MITRNNYEEFLLLYADNELSFKERQAVEEFLQANPDLQTELQLLLDSKLAAEPVSFHNKSLLYKKESLITEENYEYYFLLYVDDELTAPEKEEMQQFLLNHPDLQKQLDVLLQCKLKSEEKLVFKNKELLYKKEKPATILRLRSVQWAVAAVLTGLALTTVLLLLTKKSTITQPLAVKKENPVYIQPNNKQNPVAPSNATQQILSEEKNNPATINNSLAFEADKKQPSTTKSEIASTGLAQLNAIVKKNTNEKKIVTKPEPISSGIVTVDNLKEMEVVTAAIGSSKITPQPTTEVAPKENKEANEVVATAASTATYAKATENVTEEKNSIAVFTVSDDKVQKSGLRGLFRKVSRVINRRQTIKEEDNEDVKKIYIGSFAIARGK